MARQNGMVRVKGTVGDISYVRTKDGFLVKQKNPLEKGRIETDPRYLFTRQNMAEFGRAGKAVKLIRNSLGDALKYAKDSRLTPRMVKEMMKIVKSDTINNRGERRVLASEIEALKGFNFNLNGALETTLTAHYASSIDRATGVMQVDVPSFVASSSIVFPLGATHYQLISSGVEIDFDTQTFITSESNSQVLPLNNSVQNVTLTNNVTPDSTHTLFLAFGIQFFQQVNGFNNPMSSGGFNALAIVKITGE